LKGTLRGVVYNSITNQVVGGVSVSARSPTTTVTAQTDGLGVYTLTLPGGVYQVAAGPQLPGYPYSQSVMGVSVVGGSNVQQDFYLIPVPELIGQVSKINGGPNWAEGFVLPGENDLQLWRSVKNTGAVTATEVTGQLTSLTAGVSINSNQVLYPDIPAESIINSTIPYVFSVSKDIPCGGDLRFQQVLSSSTFIFTDTFTVTTGVPIDRQTALFMDAEESASGWTSDPPWRITDLQYYSPSHSWTDSPIGSYKNQVNLALKTPILNLSHMHKTRLSGWISYDLEQGWDYFYIEYSLDGGVSWVIKPILSFTGKSIPWNRFTIDTPFLDKQPNVQIRFRLLTDSSVTYDGVYLDDLALDYEPRACYRVILPEIHH
jgi:hypothetical protein